MPFFKHSVCVSDMKQKRFCHGIYRISNARAEMSINNTAAWKLHFLRHIQKLYSGVCFSIFADFSVFYFLRIFLSGVSVDSHFFSLPYMWRGTAPSPLNRKHIYSWFLSFSLPISLSQATKSNKRKKKEER